MLGLLLSVSVSGQLLPCVHVGAAQLVDQHHSALQQHIAQHVLSMDMPVDRPMDLTTRAPMHHDGTPASNHAPVAPGCAQLMACGLVVQVAAVVSAFDASPVEAIEVPAGLHLQYATADREVESPPPRG
jgi:hypothetical protein